MASILVLHFKYKNKSLTYNKIITALEQIKTEYHLIEFINDNLHVYFHYDKLDLINVIASLKLIPGYQTVIQTIYFNNTVKKI